MPTIPPLRLPFVGHVYNHITIKTIYAMKKLFSFLCLALIMVLSSCSNEQKILGTWVADLNMDKVAEFLEEDVDNLDKASGKITATFEKDGTAEQKIEITATMNGERHKISMKMKGKYTIDGQSIKYSDVSLRSFKIDSNDMLDMMDEDQLSQFEDEITDSIDTIKKLTSNTLELLDDDGETFVYTKQ